MKNMFKKIIAGMVAVSVLVFSAAAFPKVADVSTSMEEKNDSASNSGTLFADSVFHTSMQAYLNLESLISVSVCYKFNDMENINPREFVDSVGLLVWDADKAPDESEATYENCANIIEGAYYNSILKRFETETEGIVPKKLGDGLTFRAYYHDGYGNYEYSRLIEDYSPKTYCYNQIEKNPDDEKTINLMKSILNYGAAAQEYFDYKTDDLMNKDLEEKEEEPESEILTFSLLDDGTYGVMAGPDAATQARIEIPETHKEKAVTRILDEGFVSLSLLETIIFPEKLKVIGNSAFEGCAWLENIYFPSGLEKIGEFAFKDCSKIETIVIPTSTTFIGKFAFNNTGLLSAKLEDCTGWKLENNVVCFPSVVGMNTLNLSGNSYKQGDNTYRVSTNLSSNQFVANALRDTITLGVYNDKFDSSTTRANFYTENWIKQ